jgi:hypothetical protein
MGEKERVMEDRRGFGWAIVLAPVVLSLLIVVPARADLLVHRLDGDAQAANPATMPCCIADECATVPAEMAVESKEAADAETSKVSLFVLMTVLFSNPDDTTPPGSSTGGGPTASGGSNPPPTSHAPEPATVISALVGVCLAVFYVVFRRKRLAAPAT